MRGLARQLLPHKMKQPPFLGAVLRRSGGNAPFKWLYFDPSNWYK